MADEGSNMGSSAREAATLPSELPALTNVMELYNTWCL